jgi:hypothetical protein
LCSLLNLYENFVDTMLYGRDSIFVNDTKDAMQSKELKRKISNPNEDRSDVDLFVSRDWNKEMSGGGGSNSHSKLKFWRTSSFLL